MRKLTRLWTLTLAIVFFGSIHIFAQVGIGTTTPKATAQLDVHSTTKGVLIPRMLASERTAIVDPETSLLVFQTNNTAGYYYFNGADWIRLTDDVSVDDGDWVSNGANIERQSGDVYIGDIPETNNNLYISNSIIDWDDLSYLINPDSDSRMNEIEFDDGSSVDPSVRFSGDDNTGFYSPAENEVALSINGSQRILVNDNGTLRIDGNIGLFTDPDGPTLNQSLKLYDGDGYSNPNISISGHNSGLIYLESRRTSAETNGKKWTIGSGSGSVLDLDKFSISNPDDGNCLVIRDGGNVGIGQLIPLSTLDINGNLSLKVAEIVGGPTASRTPIVDAIYFLLRPSTGNDEFIVEDASLVPGRFYIIRNGSTSVDAKIYSAGRVFYRANYNTYTTSISLPSANNTILKTIILVSDGLNWTYFGFN